MERFLQDLDVWCWRYLENVRNYPGVHLTATPTACDALLRGLEAVRGAGDGAVRSVPLRPLARADEAKITGGQAYAGFATLRIAFRREGPELRFLCVSVEGRVVWVEFTDASFDRLRAGIDDVRRGRGDYSIAPPRGRVRAADLGGRDRASESLWFWPCFGHLFPDGSPAGG